uniref:Uncharacterized protein n=3 Tax=Anguilla anguilla TaxID=7936 RepID=A0A0E9T875_ANGAN
MSKDRMVVSASVCITVSVLEFHQLHHISGYITQCIAYTDEQNNAPQSLESSPEWLPW